VFEDSDGYFDTDSPKHTQSNTGTCVFSIDDGRYGGVVIEVDYATRHVKDMNTNTFSHQLTLTKPRSTPIHLSDKEKEDVLNGTVMMIR
jgi:hypothetical protein